MSEPQQGSRELSVPSQTGLSVTEQQEVKLQATINSVFGTLGGQTFDNFDGDKIARWKLQAAACGPDVKGIDDVPSTGIAVKYFYVHPVELDGPTEGEIVTAIRCVLIDENGLAYGFVSNYLARDLARMISVFGADVWNPPITVMVRQNKGKAGHKFYSIVPV
jgi:hypothetical protein